jgi:hypothetical protein
MRCQGGRERDRQPRGRSSVGHTRAGLLLEGVALALLSFACGEAAPEEAPSAQAPSAETPGAESPGTALYPGQPGSGERLPAEAPACDERRYPNMTTIEVMTVAGDGVARAIWSEASLDGRVIGRGTGIPEEVRELPSSFDAAGPSAWLWIEGSAAAEAAAEGDVSPTVRWLILGPSELASLPVSADDELHVDIARRLYPSYMPSSMKLEVTSNGRVLIVDQKRPLNVAPFESPGISYAPGARRCQTSDECYYYYEHAIEVTAPDGSSATLDPNSSADIGGYRVLHGSTGSTSVAEAGIDVNTFCADRAGGWDHSAVTAILLPSSS